ncbi:hypothetical protein P5V15_009040 [Pogonomyrmex californicus]
MPRNEHHQNDIFKERSVYPKAHNLLLIFISYTLLSCDLISDITYWLTEETIRVRLQMIIPLLYDLMSANQYGIFIFRCDQLMRCLKHVEEDWKNVLNADARNIMLKSARTGKRLVTICGLFMYRYLPNDSAVVPWKDRHQNTTIRYFACPGYFFSLDVQVSPVYEIIFIIQCLTAFVTVSIVTGACGLTAIFVVHVCGQLKILIGFMRNLVQIQRHEEREIDKKLTEIVEHQMRIRKNITTLFTYMISIINVTIHMFLFCYTAGRKNSHRILRVRMVSSSRNRKARSVILLMIMSNATTKISGKFIDLSLKIFGDSVDKNTFHGKRSRLLMIYSLSNFIRFELT